MSAQILSWSLDAAQALLALAMAFAAYRIVMGPRAQDRVLGLDVLYVNAMLMTLTAGIRTGRDAYFEVALIIALLRHRRAGQVPPARRGDRMSRLGDLPAWAALATAFCVLLGALLTFLGCLGLLRLGNFYDRVHTPTLGTTLGAGFVLIGSMLFFSALQGRLAIHEVLIAVFLTVTTPVTLMLLMQAALLRDRSEGHDPVPEQLPEPDLPLPSIPDGHSGDTEGGEGRRS